MAFWDRNQQLSVPLAIIAAVMVLALGFNSYLDERASLVADRNAKTKACDDAVAMQQKEIELRRFLATAGSSMTFEPSTIEGQILHLVGDWEDQTSVRNPSFQRVAEQEEHGFTRLTFQMSASGSVGQVAGFLYRVEKSPIPLRVDVAQVRPISEASSDMEIHMTVSALCRSMRERAGVAQVGADASAAAGNLSSNVPAGEVQ